MVGTDWKGREGLFPCCNYFGVNETRGVNDLIYSDIYPRRKIIKARKGRMELEPSV